MRTRVFEHTFPAVELGGPEFSFPLFADALACAQPPDEGCSKPDRLRMGQMIEACAPPS